jgi:hypothetical protein
MTVDKYIPTDKDTNRRFKKVLENVEELKLIYHQTQAQYLKDSFKRSGFTDEEKKNITSKKQEEMMQAAAKVQTLTHEDRQELLEAAWIS